MRTVQKLLKYFFNRKERRYLVKAGYSNWCWGKWGFDFSGTIKNIIKNLKWYDQVFYKKLFDDIELLCWEHDVDFTLWWTKWDFFKANFRLAWNIFRLLRWANILWKYSRVWLFIVVFRKLNKYGKKYFSFKKKKELKELFVNFNY